MDLYCNVVNNEVISGPQLLPPMFEGFPEEVLVSKGWYKVERVLPTTFHDRTEFMLPPVLEVFNTYVRATYTKRDKTVEELAAQDNAKWEEVRKYRNELLTQSDYITIIDRWNGLTEEKRTAWTVYRQALRDVPQTNPDPWNVMIPVSPDYVPPKPPKHPDMSGAIRE